MENFYDELVKVLKKDKRFFSEDGALLRNAVSEAGNRLDRDLLRMLLGNKATKKHLFADVDGTMVFDKVKFGWVVNNREFLPDSYTRFKNKIGLVDERGEFISDSRDVSLAFPYKDCVLEGGQTKEDQKRDEIFYNETLAPNEVDRLLAPKVLTNAIRYDVHGRTSNVELGIDDNLVVRGNNILAMASLLPKYEESIKLIYMDPPYNTGNDEFKYNDSFNHSTWLVFMRNRLTLAKRLLSRDGCIFIQCDDNEQAYLKVLCDEIFGSTNFVNCIAVKMSEATGVKMSHARIRFPKLKEYLLFYKREGFSGFYEIDKYVAGEWDRENNIILENFTREDREKLIAISEREEISDEDVADALKLLRNVKKKSLAAAINELGLNDAEREKWLFDNSFRIIKTCGSSSLATLVKRAGKNYTQDIACALSREGVLFFYITDYNRNTPQPRLRVIFADENLYKNPCDFWQDIKTTGAISSEGGVMLTNGKKPEKILHRIIKMTTKPGDIVLDCFAGSGTTGAVAHKMGRRYVMCEQLSRQSELIVKRLQNVIKSDETGVSKLVGWKGGGSFVYCELLQNNERFVDQIRGAKKDGELLLVWKDMQKTGFISCKYDPKKKLDFADAEFKALTLDEKKKVLMSLLDKNQLYVNLCDMDDAEFCVSAADKTFTNSFYGRK